MVPLWANIVVAGKQVKDSDRSTLFEFYDDLYLFHYDFKFL